MPLVLGTSPAPGAASQRPRRVVLACAGSRNGALSCPLPNVAGEGASHGTRGGCAPLSLHRYGLAFSVSSMARAARRVAPGPPNEATISASLAFTLARRPSSRSNSSAARAMFSGVAAP